MDKWKWHTHKNYHIYRNLFKNNETNSNKKETTQQTINFCREQSECTLFDFNVNFKHSIILNILFS